MLKQERHNEIKDKKIALKKKVEAYKKISDAQKVELAREKKAIAETK